MSRPAPRPQAVFLSAMLAFLPALGGCFPYSSKSDVKSIGKDSVLCLSVKGQITGEAAEQFMKDVRNYAGKSRIKGLLLRMDSPGGTASASQEINATIKSVRSIYKKPVVVSAGDVMASGAALAAMSSDKIFVSPATIFGSIGVIGEFLNLEELARFAKVDVYHIKSGEFKDSGSSFRKMTLRERELLETMMDTVHDQFKQSIVEGRGLKPEFVDSFSDGRVFTGADAVKMGLADKVGTYNDAVRSIGRLAGLGSNPHLFTPDDQNFISSFKKYLGSYRGEGSFFLRLLSLSLRMALSQSLNQGLNQGLNSQASAAERIMAKSLFPRFQPKLERPEPARLPLPAPAGGR